ncbi:arsenite efflux ATP-binding protein ArsA [Propionicimonas paludicola]|uniref:Arsenite efflux ATP-binding protein ArsA n=1 Tax=Propionicimonas paludicola TaxID=185243 RepID=A0A2A9CQM2_9ACTN|nr:arsenical pump-driving ATPase [Propionicimonas paludicola]PFG16375.1 arsenite efflux ATP-binding protein ArsA [Propionicimonas paludicola]
MRFLTAPTRFLFFTGKGGVGKTSIACAAALQLAEAGRRVLLVSTDPASNVGQVFSQSIGNTITAVTSVAGLDALEINPEQAAAAYRERIIGPVRGLLPKKEIESITEQLSGSCTTEIASFNEFTGLLADPSLVADYDQVVFDTAPTGHTIRLLKLPGDWTGFLDAGKGDASCLGPLSGLEKQRALYAGAVQTLADPSVTSLILVARAQASSLAEIARTADELSTTGIKPRGVVINGVLRAGTAGADSLAAAVRKREQAAIAGMPASLAAIGRDIIELKPENMVGLPALRSLLDATTATPPKAVPPSLGDLPGSLDTLIDELAADGHGLIMCMGKGGVGKTTIAAAIATRLVALGHPVHLTTTDPAGHLESTLGEAAASAGLTVSRVDPAQAVADYRSHVMNTKGKLLDDAGRAVLAEDLMSPCTEEVAVFTQFSRLVNQARSGFVVMDTAPTGHTLLLMDAAGSYHREVIRNMPSGADYTTPMMRLQNPGYTKILLVTLPETTPVLEAGVLEDDLERAGIRPWAWVINQSLAATKTSSVLLRYRAGQESGPIDAVRKRAGRLAIVPLLDREPIGRTGLSQVAP